MRKSTGIVQRAADEAMSTRRPIFALQPRRFGGVLPVEMDAVLAL
jgi:hypothetical protein